MNFETIPSSTLSSGHWLSGDLIFKIGIMEIQQPNLPSAFTTQKLDLEIWGLLNKPKATGSSSLQTGNLFERSVGMKVWVPISPRF